MQTNLQRQTTGQCFIQASRAGQGGNGSRNYREMQGSCLGQWFTHCLDFGGGLCIPLKVNLTLEVLQLRACQLYACTAVQPLKNRQAKDLNSELRERLQTFGRAVAET